MLVANNPVAKSQSEFEGVAIQHGSEMIDDEDNSSPVRTEQARSPLSKPPEDFLQENTIAQEKESSGSETLSVPHEKSSDTNDAPYDPRENAITSAIDWSGPDDDGNPQNWPLWKKNYHTIIICAGTCASTFAASAYTPGLSSVEKELQVSPVVALLPFSLYVLGLGAGGIFGSPLSEDIGRHRVYFISVFAVFPLFTLGSGFTKDIASLCITRFLAGCFASVAQSVSNGILTDIWAQPQRPMPLLFLTTMPQFGPALGPLIGGYAAAANGWRWTIWCILFFCAPISFFSLGMEETYKRKLLQRRASALNIPGPGSVYEGQNWTQTLLKFSNRTIVRPLHMLCVEPVCISLGLYSAFNWAVCYSFFAAFPYVFEHYYGFRLRAIGLTFLGLGVGSIVGFFIIMFIEKYLIPRIMQRKCGANFDPDTEPPLETRLYNAMLGGVLLPISLFLFGWTAQYQLHWILPVFAEGMFGCGYILVFMSVVQYVTMFYGPGLASSAMAGNSFLRYSFAAALPLVSVQMYRKLGVGWASSLLGFISAAFASLPWVFWWYGPNLRERTRYVGDETDAA